MRGIQEKEPHGESSMVRMPNWRTTVSMATLACADASAVLPGPLLGWWFLRQITSELQ
jgi:hypothetical protein